MTRYLQKVRLTPTVKNASASYFAVLSMAFSGLVSIPIAVHFLNKEEIGLWAVVSAVVNYLTWMDLGIGDGIGRKIAEPVAAGDQIEVNRWWTVSIVALSTLGVVLICVGTALTPWLIEVFDVSPELRSDAYVLFIGAIVLVGMGLPYRGVPGLLTAQHRFHWASIAHGISPWISTIVFYFSLRKGLGMNSYVIAMAATVLFTGILFGILVYYRPDRPRWDGVGIQMTRLKELLGLSLNISILGIAEAIFSTLPALVLAKMGGLASVPAYTITSRGPLLLATLVRRTLWAFYPQLLRLHVTGQRQNFLHKYRGVGMLTLAIALVAAGGVVAFNRWIVELLAGPSFYAGFATTAILACIVVLEPVSKVFLSLLYLVGKMGRVALVSGIATALGVLVAVAGYEYLGIPGLAAAVAIMPLALGSYGYFQGRKGGGFSKEEISLKVGGLALIGCVLLSAAGAFMPVEVVGSIPIFDKRLPLPSGAILSLAIVFVVGGMLLGMRALRVIRA